MAIERIDLLTPQLFLDGPSESLVKQCVLEILKVPQFKELFGESIDPYQRMDYSIRELPSMRIYNTDYVKEFESWFENGDLMIDVILPPRLRREEEQFVVDAIAAALVQQFRRQTFFSTMCELVPGLNELGKRVTVNKRLAFEWGEDLVPMLQLTVNFRIDLRIWNDYMTESGRTIDQPFEVTLANLKRISSEILGLKDNGVVDPVIKTDQKI